MATGTVPGSPTEATFSFEKAAKVSTLALPAIYVCGFVVISLYEGGFGIADFTLIKVRALAAGLLFVVFLAIPSLMGIRSFRMLGMRNPGGIRVDVRDDSQKIYFWIIKTAEFYYQCVFISMVFGFFFGPRLRNWIVDTPNYQQPGHFSWLVQCAGLVTVMTFALPFVQSQSVAKSLAFKPVRCTLLVCLTFVLWIVWTVRMSDWLFFQLSAWIYLAGLCAVAAATLVRGGLGFTKADWELRLLAGLSIAVTWFASSMYGNIRPAFGGGSPVPARFYLQQDNPVLGARTADAMIIDETEQGYYVVKSAGSKEALFVPRSQVVSVQLASRTR